MYKARLVAQVFRQVKGLDYFETFSPVVRYDSIRFLLAFFAAFGFQIHRMDVASAFLNGILDVEIYMVQPPALFVQVQKRKCVVYIKVCMV